MEENNCISILLHLLLSIEMTQQMRKASRGIIYLTVRATRKRFRKRGRSKAPQMGLTGGSERVEPDTHVPTCPDVGEVWASCPDAGSNPTSEKLGM